MFSVSKVVSVKCCGLNKEFTHEHEAWDWLLDHVYVHHDWDLWPAVDRRARLEARSQNGMGYYDDEHRDGWSKAAESFKDAHRRTVLRRMAEEAGR